MSRIVFCGHIRDFNEHHKLEEKYDTGLHGHVVFESRSQQRSAPGHGLMSGRDLVSALEGSL